MYELKWNTVHQIIMNQSITLIHKSVYENKPKAVTEFYTYSLNTNNNIRSTRKILNAGYLGEMIKSGVGVSMAVGIDRNISTGV